MEYADLPKLSFARSLSLFAEGATRLIPSHLVDQRRRFIEPVGVEGEAFGILRKGSGFSEQVAEVTPCFPSQLLVWLL